MVKKENKYLIRGDTVEVYYDNANGSFLCDIDDWKRLKKHCWCCGKDGYPISRTGDKINSRFHSMVMDVPKGMYCDHISRDRSDNRKRNLRVVTPGENSRNVSIKRNNTSGCAGVSYYKNLDKYRAYITVNKKQKSLGYYSEFNDAVRARLEAGAKYETHSDRAM